jgi:hypothetical protein
VGNNVGQTPWYYRIDNWEKYIEYMASKEIGKIKARPKWMKYHEWNPIGVDTDDIEI